MSVQTMVEHPYVYLLVRSGASVKDQLLYVPTHFEHLADLKNLLVLKDGRTYHDVMHFFSGMVQ